MDICGLAEAVLEFGCRRPEVDDCSLLLFSPGQLNRLRRRAPDARFYGRI
jgi:hypothetical protein